MWLLSTKKNNLVKDAFHYIDDLCAINGNAEFEKNFKSIYPEELELKKENKSPLHASFTDLPIHIERSKFHTILNDKMMLSHLTFSVCFTVIAICNLKYFMHKLPPKFCALLEPTLFINRTKVLLKHMYKQGCKEEHLQKVLNKIYGIHVTDFKKFVHTTEKIIDLFYLLILSGLWVLTNPPIPLIKNVFSFFVVVLIVWRLLQLYFDSWRGLGVDRS